MPMTSVRMPEHLMDKLEAVAEKLDRSKGWIIKEALSQYVAHLDREEQRLLDTRQAVADIESGNIIDGDEVIAWIESWGSDNEKPTPQI